MVGRAERSALIRRATSNLWRGAVALVKPCRPLNLGSRLLAQDLSSLNHLAFTWNGRRVAGGRKRVAKRMVARLRWEKKLLEELVGPSSSFGPDLSFATYLLPLFFSPFLHSPYPSLPFLPHPLNLLSPCFQARRQGIAVASFQAFAYRATLNFNPLLFERVTGLELDRYIYIFRKKVYSRCIPLMINRDF